MIVIINGPLGIGKTSVAEEVQTRFDTSIMLDGDFIGAVHPFEIYDDDRIEYLYQTMRHLIAFHVENGYRHFVINYVFETPESLARLKSLLAGLSGPIHAFRLTCAPAEMERRIRRRGRKQIDWELRRFKELIAIQDAAATRGEMGTLIDTTHLTVPQVADVIRDAVQQTKN